MTESSAFASSTARRMLSLSVSTGFQTTVTGMSEDSCKPSATALDCSATWRRVSSPYRPWLPVRNHTW
jgi:hypothetical protein